jgi:hypothetical protein
MSTPRLLALCFVLASVAACTPDGGTDDGGTGGGAATGGGTGGGSVTGGGTGGGAALDAGADAGTPVDAGTDAGTHVDAGTEVDAGADAGTEVDAGTDAGTVVDGGTVIDAGVECQQPSDCPGADTECQARTCTAGVCGNSFALQGTLSATQTPGDCLVNECDGMGSVAPVVLNTDVPDDHNDCTEDRCSAGVPSNVPSAAGATCSSNSGAFCNGAGACVACLQASDCTGQDTACQTRTCTAGQCGVSYFPALTALPNQTAGDCHTNECDGFGAPVSVVTNSDVPDDNNACTSDVCSAGTPSHAPQAVDFACSQGGAYCDGAGTCVACNTASQCPGSDTECQQRTCTTHVCGLAALPAGTVLASQVTGDCQQRQCTSAATVTTVAFDADVPVDNNPCTGDVCASGVPSNPPSPAGTTCNQGSGLVCDGASACVGAPTVASTTPADGSAPLASTPIAVTFSTRMDPTTLTAQTAAGACTGSVQVSLDGFSSCVAFASATATLSGAGTTATFTPAPGLLVNRTYQLRVTTAAKGTGGLALGATFTQPSGFTTTSPNLCEGTVVISQVYGGSGSSGSSYDRDFVELHNRGTVAVDLTGWSLQTAAPTGSTWQALALSGTIAANGYFLVGLASDTNGAGLPTPDFSGTTVLAPANGKVALVHATTAMATGACPSGGKVADFVAYGATDCAEGSAAGAGSATSAVSRVGSGCADTDQNGLDFTVGAPTPRNSASTQACTCTVQNEGNGPLEANYCDVQFPLSLSGHPGDASTVYGQVYEQNVTEANGASANVRAQLGYGPTSANPQYQAWTWLNATYNAQKSNNDEYQASFTLPAAGVYGYAYRVSLDQGVTWTLCDQAAGDMGAGSNPGLTFSLGDVPTLTVTP